MEVAHTPSSRSSATSAATASASPETAVEDGPLTAATESWPAMRSRTASTGNGTEAMPPSPASARMARLRRATTFAPSSRLRPPATTAAAISPCE